MYKEIAILFQIPETSYSWWDIAELSAIRLRLTVYDFIMPTNDMAYEQQRSLIDSTYTLTSVKYLCNQFMLLKVLATHEQ